MPRALLAALFALTACLAAACASTPEPVSDAPASATDEAEAATYAPDEPLEYDDLEGVVAHRKNWAEYRHDIDFSGDADVYLLSGPEARQLIEADGQGSLFEWDREIARYLGELFARDDSKMVIVDTADHPYATPVTVIVAYPTNMPPPEGYPADSFYMFELGVARIELENYLPEEEDDLPFTYEEPQNLEDFALDWDVLDEEDFTQKRADPKTDRRKRKTAKIRAGKRTDVSAKRRNCGLRSAFDRRAHH